MSDLQELARKYARCAELLEEASRLQGQIMEASLRASRTMMPFDMDIPASSPRMSEPILQPFTTIPPGTAEPCPVPNKGLKAKVLDCINDSGGRAWTPYELACATLIPAKTVSAICNELHREGFIGKPIRGKFVEITNPEPQAGKPDKEAQ